MPTPLLVCLLALASGEEQSQTFTLDQIHLRDPFVLPVPEEKKYYLFGTHAGAPYDFQVYVSADLKAWEGPSLAFERPPDFWADRDFWAPEVHRYKGRYYLFASFKAEGVCRGTQILVADRPQGPYRPHSARSVTPRDWECLDGTFFLDEAGQPWIVFCHEWLQTHDGEICAMRLTPDLDKSEGDPILLFRASSAPWVKKIGFGSRKGLVTDGPFLHRTARGDLLLLWSSFGPLYAQSIARSESGRLLGPWKQEEHPWYAKDGGHGMLFRTFENNLMLVLHQPNLKERERPRLFQVQEQDGALTYTPWP